LSLTLHNTHTVTIRLAQQLQNEVIPQWERVSPNGSGAPSGKNVAQIKKN